ncbi:hypothetical protein [Paraclostridium sordellii]|uniref:hypothetical protein n=1 Tax=Paraclostridium sordellii TaxID=1505 RepID=UPI0005E54566|nr:hypothetical protein [Paeniclostridium sordellii]CEQ14840.1 Uncharacterised protein [[Clostridium] sordellii] [Paeniclostridium sordellii]
MEKMPVDILIEGLEEWNKKRNSKKAQDYLTLLSILNGDLGNDLSEIFNPDEGIQKQLDLLRARVIELSTEQNINQVMIVEGIVSRISRYFRRSYSATLRNLIMFESIDKNEMPHAEHLAEKLKNPEYLIGMELDETEWDSIVSKHFNDFLLGLMDTQNILKEIEKLKKQN